MARKIFNQPSGDDRTTQAPAPAPPKTAKLPGSVGGLRESLREITANSIRDIDPAQIEMDGLRDRLILEDDSIDELAESIRKHGQQVPIMVRPAEQPDRYRIVYGRRRLAAIRKAGGTIKAIVRTLDDDASLIAQGQENNLRLDPSFIEKSIFIKEMKAAGFEPSVIQDALGLTRQGVSNHRVVIDQLPDGLVPLIGPAHGVGRRQWAELAVLAAKVDAVDIAQKVLSPLPGHTTSQEKFKAVYAACLDTARGPKKSGKRSTKTVLKTGNGTPVGVMSADDASVAIKITRKDNPEFSQWFEDHAETSFQQLFDQWQSERGSGS